MPTVNSKTLQNIAKYASPQLFGEAFEFLDTPYKDYQFGTLPMNYTLGRNMLGLIHPDNIYATIMGADTQNMFKRQAIRLYDPNAPFYAPTRFLKADGNVVTTTGEDFLSQELQRDVPVVEHVISNGSQISPDFSGIAINNNPVMIAHTLYGNEPQTYIHEFMGHGTEHIIKQLFPNVDLMAPYDKVARLMNTTHSKKSATGKELRASLKEFKLREYLKILEEKPRWRQLLEEGYAEAVIPAMQKMLKERITGYSVDDIATRLRDLGSTYGADYSSTVKGSSIRTDQIKNLLLNNLSISSALVSALLAKKLTQQDTDQSEQVVNQSEQDIDSVGEEAF